MSGGVEAVVFDWGGTLTAWHDIDFHAESLALAQAVVNADHDLEVSRERLHAAGATVWGRSRDHQQSATIADLFTEAGLDHDPKLLRGYYEFWEPHTLTDPDVAPLFAALREQGIKVGVLSNTLLKLALVLLIGHGAFRGLAAGGLLAMAAASVAGLWLFW